jgi:large subunit ribosomal protein L21
MKYAVIRTGGKQYKVIEGDVIDIERITDAPEATVTFSEVLMVTADGEVSLGAPLLSNVTVKGTVLEALRGDKIRVAKYKAKVRYRRVTGHRQALSRVKIESIDMPGEKKTSSRKTELKADAAVKAPGTVKKAAKRTEKAPVKTS